MVDAQSDIYSLVTDMPVNDSTWPQRAEHLVEDLVAMAAPPPSRMTT